MVNGN